MLSEAEAAVAEEGMLTPAAAAAATSADPANVAAMDFAASDTAPALGTAAAVPEAEAFAGTKAATKEVEAAIAEEGIPTPAAAAIAFSAPSPTAAVSATPPTVRTLRSRDRDLLGSKKTNQHQPPATQRGKTQKPGRRAGTAVQEMLIVKTVSASNPTTPSPGFHLGNSNPITLLGKRLLEELSKMKRAHNLIKTWTQMKMMCHLLVARRSQVQSVTMWQF